MASFVQRDELVEIICRRLLATKGTPGKAIDYLPRSGRILIRCNKRDSRPMLRRLRSLDLEPVNPNGRYGTMTGLFDRVVIGTDFGLARIGPLFAQRELTLPLGPHVDRQLDDMWIGE